MYLKFINYDSGSVAYAGPFIWVQLRFGTIDSDQGKDIATQLPGGIWMYKDGMFTNVAFIEGNPA